MLRKARSQAGEKMLEADAIRRLLKAASPQIRAMCYLGVNCGFGNSDCAHLPKKAFDLKKGWVDYPRPKTGVERRCPLWPETLQALKDSELARPEAKDKKHHHLMFITHAGNPWHKETSDNPITKEFRKLLGKLSLHRPRIGFYTLRHVFETIAGECRDQVAVDYIMGHARQDMASAYRERISDERLKAATDHVHSWMKLKTTKKQSRPAKKNAKSRR